MTTPGDSRPEERPTPFEPMPTAPALDERELGGPAVDRPKQVRVAFVLWLIVGFVLLIGVILALSLSTQALQDAARTGLERQGRHPTDQEVTDAATFIRAFGVGYNLIFGALTVLFASFMRAGRGWARIVLCVLGGIVLLFTLLGAGAGGAVNLLISVAQLVVIAVATYFMFRPESKQFFAARKVRR